MEVGGQAVIEGVMMKNGPKISVAVRLPNGKIKLKKETHNSIVNRYKALKKQAPLPPIPGSKKTGVQLKKEELDRLKTKIETLIAKIAPLKNKAHTRNQGTLQSKTKLNELRDQLVRLWTGVDP